MWELLGAVPEQELLALARALAGAEPLGLLEGCRELLERGREPGAVLQGLVSLLRDLVLAGAAPDRLELTGVSAQFRGELPELARSIGKARLLQWQAQLKGSEQQLRHSVNPRLWLEVLLLGLLAEAVVLAPAKPAALSPAPVTPAPVTPAAVTPAPVQPAPAPSQRPCPKPRSNQTQRPNQPRYPKPQRPLGRQTLPSFGNRSWRAWSCPPPACCSPSRPNWCGWMSVEPWCRWPATGWPWCRAVCPCWKRPSPMPWAARASSCWRVVAPIHRRQSPPPQRPNLLLAPFRAQFRLQPRLQSRAQSRQHNHNRLRS